MTKRSIKNTPASIRERLLNKAREKGRLFNEILQYFAMERFLYRFSLSAYAEKFEAMIKLGILNSRLKDFYDIWFLSQQFDFDGQTLTTAIKKTFSNRGTQLPSHLNILTGHFAQDPSKKAQWRGFIRKNILKNVPEELSEVVTGIADFLGPVIDTLTAGQKLKGAWHAHGPARRWDPIFGKE